MRLWTIQPREEYDLIDSAGVYRCDGARSELITEFDFEKLYRWLAAQMAKRVGPPPERVEFPVWAWHTLNWKHRRPDMRWTEIRSTYSIGVVRPRNVNVMRTRSPMRG